MSSKFSFIMGMIMGIIFGIGGMVICQKAKESNELLEAEEVENPDETKRGLKDRLHEWKMERVRKEFEE